MDVLDQLGATLAGRYTIEHRIGSGGMAVVYLARDVKHDRLVALKVLNPDLGAVLGVERFLSEIRVTANLHHPNLLPLFDSGEAGGLLFYTMPYVEGETLRARLTRETQLPVDEALRLAAAVGSALDFAHRHGVIHRDLKPENILLQDGQAVVADFGIALAVSNAGGERVTQTGLSLGTPQYMSPEQATGDRTIDARSDVYSLAAVLYEMLTGEPPHAGGSAQAIIAKLLTQDPAPVTTLRPSVPPHVAAAVRRGLERVAADRFATAHEFVAAFMEPGAAAHSATRVTTPDSASAANGSDAPAPRRVMRRGSIAAIAGVVVAAAVIAAVMARRGPSGARAADTADKSIAVLPLANLSGDTTNAYFGEGLAEELQDALGKTGLRVIGRTSARSLAAKGLDAEAVARQLGVASVLDGSVQREGNRIRVTVHLIAAKDGAQLWTDRYDRDARDVFAMQDEIARSVASQLRVTLGGDGAGGTAPDQALVRDETTDPEAHALYLQGLYLYNRRSAANFARMIALFEQASRRDPRYARPLAGLAMAYSIEPAFRDMSADSAEAAARSTAERALAIDSTISEAHAVLGWAAASQFQNAEGAREFQRAMAIDSTIAYTVQRYAQFLNHIGKFTEAVRQIDRARALDPASLAIGASVADMLCNARRCDEAVNVARRTLSMDSTYGLAGYLLGTSLLGDGKYADGVAQLAPMSASPELRPSFAAAWLAYGYARLGRVADARAAIARSRAAAGPNPPIALAAAIYALGEHDQGIAVLRQAMEGHDVMILLQAHLEVFDELRRDPRAAAMFARAEAP